MKKVIVYKIDRKDGGGIQKWHTRTDPKRVKTVSKEHKILLNSL